MSAVPGRVNPNPVAFDTEAAKVEPPAAESRRWKGAAMAGSRPKPKSPFTDRWGVVFEGDLPTTSAEAMAAPEEGLAGYYRRERIELP